MKKTNVSKFVFIFYWFIETNKKIWYFTISIFSITTWQYHTLDPTFRFLVIIINFNFSYEHFIGFF